MEIYKGWVNNFFRDTSLNLKMTASIAFNPKAITGKTIEIKAGSEVSDKAGQSKEISGKWLIINSIKFADPDGVAYTHLLLAKSSVELDSNHPFKSDFL